MSTCVRVALAWACLLGCGDSASSPEDESARDAAMGGRGRDASVKDAASGGGSNRDDGGGAGVSRSDGGDQPASDSGANIDQCAATAAGALHELLSCTGLYLDIEDKRIARGMREFAPAVQLWSDGADKQRWIFLPEDTQIDSALSDDWKFPIGTKLFKEFSHAGRRIETRLFWKIAATRWLRTAYRWNESETEAVRFDGGDIDVAGDTYHIPTAKECDQCHKGRDDRVLGFEPGLLGLSGATGLTLSELVAEGLLTEDPALTELEIGDDGTTKAAAALGWLHVNCGVSCHNPNSAAEGYASRLHLQLNGEELDGRTSSAFPALESGVGVSARTLRWTGRIRIVPGSPEQSLLYELANTRDPSRPKDQMPPIASRITDPDGLRALEDWISSMPATAPSVEPQ
jgi:hypothetical protein